MISCLIQYNSFKSNNVCIAWHGMDAVNAKTTTTSAAGIGLRRVHFENLGKKGKSRVADAEPNNRCRQLSSEFEFWPWLTELCIKEGLFIPNCQLEKGKLPGNIISSIPLKPPYLSYPAGSQILLSPIDDQPCSFSWIHCRKTFCFFQKKNQLHHGIQNEPRQEDLHWRPPKWCQQVSNSFILIITRVLFVWES